METQNKTQNTKLPVCIGKFNSDRPKCFRCLWVDQCILVTRNKSQVQNSEVKEAVFRVRGGIVVIPYTDPKALERILEGVKKLREESLSRSDVYE